jgi:dual specificity tyrosine-phosphorylation-regulated kinase 2/3/4
MGYGGLKISNVATRESMDQKSPGMAKRPLPLADGDGGLMVPSDSRLSGHGKRSTSSGIPFFRRSSSSSSNAMAMAAVSKGGHGQQGKEAATTTTTSASSANPQTQNNRKTILGVGLSLLKGSSSRRNLQRQPSQEQMQASAGLLNATDRPKHERKGSLGWSRKRSKVIR